MTVTMIARVNAQMMAVLMVLVSVVLVVLVSVVSLCERLEVVCKQSTK